MATPSGADTVQGQLDSMLKSDSPLMKQAETFGKQQANKRGLLNSSMAAGASQNAMIQNAMPAAMQDAGAQQDLNELQATSQANAWGVMSNNITDIVAQSMDAINNIQAATNFDPEHKSKMIKQITDMRDTDIKFQQDLYGSLAGFLKDTGVFPSL